MLSNIDIFVCSNDVDELKALQVDLLAQQSIANDLLYEVHKRFKFPYQRQCVLETVRVEAATISNLQKLIAVLTDREDISKSELHNLHVAVDSHVSYLRREVEHWLSYVLPNVIGTARSEAYYRELEVSRSGYQYNIIIGISHVSKNVTTFSR